MGILDFPGVALTWIDGAVAGVVPDTVRLVLWGVLAGVATMALYARISRQDRLADLKHQSRAARAALAAYDGDLSGAVDLAKDNLGIALARLRLALVPALVAGLPMLVVAVWMSGSYAYERLADGARIAMVTVADDASGTRATNAVATVTADDGGALAVVDGQGVPIVSLAQGRLSDTIHRWQWWNLLIGNPAGYLPADSAVTEVTVALPQARYLPGVPDWMAGWEFLYLLTTTLASLATKLLLRLD